VGGIFCPPKRISPGHGDKKQILPLSFLLFFFAVFETFFDQPHYFRSKILPMKIIPAPSVCLPNENGGEKKDMI
jgi:hypothetical protein